MRVNGESKVQDQKDWAAPHSTCSLCVLDLWGDLYLNKTALFRVTQIWINRLWSSMGPKVLPHPNFPTGFTFVQFQQWLHHKRSPYVGLSQGTRSVSTGKTESISKWDFATVCVLTLNTLLCFMKAYLSTTSYACLPILRLTINEGHVDRYIRAFHIKWRSRHGSNVGIGHGWYQQRCYLHVNMLTGVNMVSTEVLFTC